MEIFIESNKTDQLRDSAWVVIAHTGTPLCPVTMLERYMHMANISDTHDKCLFRAIVNTVRNSGNLVLSAIPERENWFLKSCLL